MDTLGFLKKILPTAGWYILDTPNDGGQGFRHYVKQTIGEVAELAGLMNENGNTVYHACASFEHESVDRVKDGKAYKARRVQENVKFLRSLWLDLDVEADNPKKYPDQKSALVDLVQFLKETKLPVPMMVSSGYGVHLYWPLTENVLPGQWKSASAMLKALCDAHEFKADPMRTMDTASVLRPVGTDNRKDARNPRPVRLLQDANAVSFLDLYKLLERACTNAGVEAQKPRAPVSKAAADSINAQFAVQTEFPNSYAEEVAHKCQQIRMVRDTRGNVPEPHWYAAIQLLYHTVESRDIIHAWSSGYEGYSEAETDRKIEQIKGFGPTTCAKFDQVNAAGCVGCPLKTNKRITSPIQAGTRVEVAPAPQVAMPTIESVPGSEVVGEVKLRVVDLPNPPAPFIRGADGLYRVDADGIKIKFHNYDLHPMERSFDEHEGFESVSIRHHTPHDGVLEFMFPSGLLEDPKKLRVELKSKSVHFNPGMGDMMVDYISQYVHTLQATAPARHKYASLGWQENGSFVLGSKLLVPNGSGGVSVEHAGIAAKGANILRGVRASGELQPWVDMTQILGKPGMEAHAFVFLAGIGAPFLHALGHRGATLSMLGRTGTGKTLVGKFMLSAYGNPAELVGSQSDTPKAKIERIGFMRNLPVYIDEITNMDPELLSQTIYSVSEGKGPVRLRPDGTPRPSSEWATFLIVSTNQSLHGKLRVNKTDPEAEQMRLFEVIVNSPGDASLREFYELSQAVLPNNFGRAGEVLMQWAVRQDRAKLAESLATIVKAIDERTGAHGKERFWSATAGAALYTGHVMSQLGLIKFDYRKLMPWVMGQITNMRSDLKEHKVGPSDVLGLYLDSHSNGRLVVGAGIGTGANGTMDTGIANSGRTVLRAPTAPLCVRIETDKAVGYISRSSINDYLTKRGLDYNALRNALTSAGVVIDTDARKVLGAGTYWAAGKVPTWKIDMSHPDMADLFEASKVPQQEGVAA